MKAYEVFYQTGGESAKMIVLVRDGQSLEEAVSNKDNDFKIGDRWSKINHKSEMPLSNVLVSDLSVTELLDLMKIIL